MKSKLRNVKAKSKRIRIVRRTKHSKKDIASLLIAFASVLFIVIFSFWLGKQIYDYRINAAPAGWVGNDRNMFKSSTWFAQHGYSDCPSEAGGFWPTSRLDCLISEPASGPTAQDQTVAKEPPGLYYKHLLPTDFLQTIPTLITNINFEGINKQTLENTLVSAVQQNPTAYANISVDSIDAGIEGGNTGTLIRSLTLYVHPQLERPISNAIGVLQRAKNLYKPFIEGATGATVSDADLTEIYTAALNKCGNHSLNGDQSGLGVFKVVGQYIVVVQGWNLMDGNSVFGGDCNIHVVELNAGSVSASPPPPPGVTPTFVCLGCTPSAVPTVAPTSIIAPTTIVVPTTIEEPTGVISPPPGAPPSNRPGLIQILLALIQLFLGFLLSLFGGGR